jgi:hypothetical protein
MAVLAIPALRAVMRVALPDATSTAAACAMVLLAALWLELVRRLARRL